MCAFYRFRNGNQQTSTSSAGPFPGKFAGGANLQATFRNVKRKTKGLPYNVLKIGNVSKIGNAKKSL